MSSLHELCSCVLLLCIIVIINCESYNERPKIKMENGDLIFEPAFDKSIYLKRNGPKSSVYLDDLNISMLQNFIINSDYLLTKEIIKSQNVYQQDDLQNRVERLDRSINDLNKLHSNISYLFRRFSKLKTRLRALELLVNSKDINGCKSQPCENGGTCLNLLNGYYCLCPSNWKGTDCKEDVNECRNYAGTDLGCQNGATCINRPGSYECLCRAGWFGIDCTRKAKDCTGGDYEMCGHGTCIPVTTGEGIKCFCNQGWTTNGTDVACLTDVNECDSGQTAHCSTNPKVDCINLPGSFRCGRCPIGYEGDGYVCHDIDECLTLNGGCSTSPMVACHNTIGSRICGSCPPGFQGDGVTCLWRGSCSINHGGCHPSARCIEDSVSSSQIAQCVCPQGMDGDGVGLQGCYIATIDNRTHNCADNPCGEHGHCHALNQGYTCICFQGYGGSHCEGTSDFCSSIPCLNGGTCKPDGTKSKGYRCECSALYSGELCHIHSQPCGGYLDSEEGSIVYPLSNITYSHNERCAWVIHTSSDKVINVTFSKFDVEADSECYFDFIQIHDGRSSASQLIGRFCGTNFPNGGNIISSHNNLYFWFRSDHSVAKSGFALHWTSIPPLCGGEVDASKHGRISSPGSPGKYPPNRNCFWHLQTTLGKRIQLHFFQLDIEGHANCSFDYLAIYDGEHISDPLINKYCNSTQPVPIQSSSSEMLIYFHSDATTNGKGFQIVYAPIEGVPGCGGFYSTDRGEIVSPSYNGAYLNNLLCEYRIKTRQDTKIRLTFQKFNLERSSMCRYDFLKVFDGSSSDSRLVGKFCGNIYPKAYTSTTNELFVIFKTDHTTSSEGFKIIYEAVCAKTIRGDSGIIKSPGYPFNYPKYIQCEYTITTSPGKAIILTFQDFDLEDNRYYNCQFDHVEIRDGPSINSTLLGRYCGGNESTPPVKTSTYNYMYIKFKSDTSITGRGFYANFTTVNTECGGIYKNNSGVINHPGENELFYSNNQTCTWMLIAPESMHILLTWNRFDLESSNCLADYVQLIELDESNKNNTLGKYCGNSLPPAWTTSSNRLQVFFFSDTTYTGKGFSLSYTFTYERTNCGGLYVKSHGFIYSPGWPKSYEPNRDCTWKITAPAGQQVLLNITDFDLERPIRDSCNLGDYIIIRDGSSEKSPLIGKFCGYFKSKRIVSTSNNIYIHFHSDFYLTGKGFKIEWDGTISGCGGTLTSLQGSISSPNYPENYNDNAECFYRIVTAGGSRIAISFTELDLERSRDCKDYLELFDGHDSNSHSLGRYCYKSSQLNDIQTTSNHAFMKFRSDIFITGKGFLLHYNTICNNNISGHYGVIESPGYPDKYPTSSNCLWTIKVPKGNKINITFTNFEVYNSISRPVAEVFRMYHVRNLHRMEPCYQDYVQIRETVDENFGRKLCGTKLQTISSKKNFLQVKFVSSSPFPQKGFRLEWVSYGCGGHIQKPSGSLSFDKILSSAGEIECEWIIETPLGTAVSIVFSDLYMMETRNCTEDAIEVYNGQSTVFPLLSRFCNRHKTTIQASSNFMYIRLLKHSTLRDVNFQSRFNSFAEGCGGRIVSSSGLIHSKNYPKNYDNNLDCVWIISVPKYHRIKLEFLDFDLYFIGQENVRKKSDDNCGDMIKIYESENIFNTNYSHLLCPDWNRTVIYSKESSILVQFTTDSYGSAKGFKANFTMTCGATIEAFSDGVITNDNYISQNNQNCTWTILAMKSNEKVKLMIEHISLPKDPDILTIRNCPSSFLRVFDGNDDDAPLIGEFCGTKVPPMIVSHGNALTVQLGTYSEIIVGRFSAHYSSLSAACGGRLTSEEGSVASPNYPQSYPNNADCEWTLSTSPGNRVFITFEKFDLAYSEGCNEDYLEIREIDSGGNLLALYCGNEIPTNTTTGTIMYLKFRSSSKKPGQGFIFHYGFLYGNEITGLEGGEISSPLYPIPYEGTGEFSWRIITDTSATISLITDHLEIVRHNESCGSQLRIYDGYDEEAPLLNVLCGMFKNENNNVQTSSNVAYIKLVLDSSRRGALFHIKWAQSDKNLDTSNLSSNKNCGLNHTEIVLPQSNFILSSPNYPDPYGPDLNCEWIFHAISGYHLSLTFKEIKLEEVNSCLADHISIFSSNKGLQWQPLEENICLPEFENKEIASMSFMKVKFISDGYISRKGFQGTVRSVCGGLLESTSGFVEVTWFDYSSIQFHIQPKIICNWTVKVRPGRTIKSTFVHFNITNVNKCKTFILIKNGESVESPILGKYCGYEHENMNEIISSTNAMYISYRTENTYMPLKGVFQNFKLRYEETNIECGATSTLDMDHSWEIINSPNYPSIPVPYTECIWTFTGPPGEILRIDFLDRFDLESTKQCEFEFVEVKDGFSELSTPKGRFCREPGTVKANSNTMFIKYSTQILEPRNGFKANVSIDVCGGSIVAESGQIISPGYPHMSVLPPGSVCEWHIISNARHVILLEFKDFDLSESKKRCGFKVSVEEPILNNGSAGLIVLKEYCNDNLEFSKKIESLSNKVVVKLHIGKPSHWSGSPESRGFKLIFNSSRPSCGDSVTASYGYIMTPGYPRETSLRYYQWDITTPNENRRIRLELMDFDINQNFGILNEITFSHSLDEYTISKNVSGAVPIFESTGNSVSFFLWMGPTSKTKHRFKARYNSDEPALCGGNLKGIEGHLRSPNLDRSYVCQWNYNYFDQPSDSLIPYGSIYVIINITSSVGKNCHYSVSRLVLFSNILGSKPLDSLFIRNVCGNYSNLIYRIPSTSVKFKATQYPHNSIMFDVDWILQPCGGLILSGQKSDSILNIPIAHNQTINCAWIIRSPPGVRIKLQLEGTFNLDCSDEYLQISEKITETSLVIGEFCKTKIQTDPLLSSLSVLYVQYHSKPQNSTNIKITSQIATNLCGGLLTKYDRIFNSPNYPKNYRENQECIWKIETEAGYRVSLKFIERFAIENTANCTKDVIIIYDWIENEYKEMDRLCGRQLPLVFNSTRNRMKVVFRTNADINLDGFKAMWTPICGGIYVAKFQEQFLYSPGYYENYSSHPFLNCVYEIIATSKQMILKFLDFELEGSYPECKYDNLTISHQSDSNLFYGVYCGKEIPPPIQSYNSITITLKTNFFLQRKLFKLSYSLYNCGGIIREQTVLTSGILDTYSDNSNCTWLIEAPHNKIVILKFLYIDIESSYDCNSDYVAVYNGLQLHSKERIALLCGRLNSTTIVKSKENSMILQFVSDSYLNYKGFKAEVIFTYSEAVGCGGTINLNSSGQYQLISPRFNNSPVYENYLDCHWTIKAPVDKIVKVEFTYFHIASCMNVNQTELGYDKCDCDLVEFKDGLNPTSLIIGTYCGHNIPSPILSSNNVMSIRFATDGEIQSSGFEIKLSSQNSVCGQSFFTVSEKIQLVKSPAYETGSIPRGLHCNYFFDASLNSNAPVHIRIKNLDLEAGNAFGGCNKDKMIITGYSHHPNVSFGKDLIVNVGNDNLFSNAYLYESTLNFPKHITLCGTQKSIDYYFSSNIYIDLQTSADSSTLHRGVELEVSSSGLCGRNYTELQGRIFSYNSYSAERTSNRDCYTLITVPQNYTISVYFILISPSYINENVFLNIIDGNETSAPLLYRVSTEYSGETQLFSIGRYLLFHNHMIEDEAVTYDLIYVATNKGRGCGGHIHSELGKVTSPLYPLEYRKKSTCEWELETPTNTRLFLHFVAFDLGRACDQNYLRLVDRDGNTISTFCSETPADYTSENNYVKIVFTTTMNNGGTGWVADFIGVA